MFLPPRAYVFIGLNIARALSIVALLLVFASSVVVMVDDIKAVNVFENGGGNQTSQDYIDNSTVPDQTGGPFWAVLNRLLILAQTVVLVFSEIEWPLSFFDRFFPVLGSEFGLGALGVMQCLIGASVLSHFVDTFPLVAAFFLFSVGCLNILLGLIFREHAKSKRSIFSFRERTKNVLPTTHDFGVTNEKSYGTPERALSGRSGHGFGRQAEAQAAYNGFAVREPEAAAQ